MAGFRPQWGLGVSSALGTFTRHHQVSSYIPSWLLTA